MPTTPPSPSDPAGTPESAVDGLVRRLCREEFGLTGAEAAGVERWWAARRERGEGLAPFLVRMGVLKPNIERDLSLVAKGYVSVPVASLVLTVEGPALLRQPPTESDPQPVLPPSPNDSSVATAAMPIRPLSRGPVADLPRPPALAVGTVLGKCLLIERVGQGATGVVFRALHQSLNIPVAVKVLGHSVGTADGAVARQFRTEARLLAQLSHPHVVRVLDFEDGPGTVFLVMEYVEGLSLAELVASSGRLRLDRAVAVVRQVADGLAAALRVGIVHRDVKPANILVARDGSAKLADLGLAVLLGDGEADRGAGTVAYMAPEQAAGGPRLDHRADIYALGATFYHVLTGTMPFSGRSRAEVLMQHARAAPRPPREMAPDIGMAASRVVLKMMAKRPDDRYPSYDELRGDLAELAGDRGFDPTRSGPWATPIPVADSTPPPSSTHPLAAPVPPPSRSGVRAWLQTLRTRPAPPRDSRE